MNDERITFNTVNAVDTDMIVIIAVLGFKPAARSL